MGVSSTSQVCSLSFTGQFAIKAGESNSKSLKSTERIIIVQSEHIFCYTTELHHNVVSWGGKKRFRDQQFHREAKKTNKWTKVQKYLAVPNISGIHPLSPNWLKIFSLGWLWYSRDYQEPRTTPLFCWVEGVTLTFLPLQEACICSLFCWTTAPAPIPEKVRSFIIFLTAETSSVIVSCLLSSSLPSPGRVSYSSKTSWNILCFPCLNDTPPPILHQTLTVIVMDNLEVLHWSLSDSPMEVQNVGLSIIIPDWSLVVQLNEVL